MGKKKTSWVDDWIMTGLRLVNHQQVKYLQQLSKLPKKKKS